MKRTVSLLTVAVVLLSGLVIINDIYPKPKFIKVVKEVMPAVVDIRCVVDIPNPFNEQPEKRGIEGSGVYVSAKGYILTCGHLFNFKKIYSINVTNSDGETVAAELVAADFNKDLALIRTTYYKTTPFVQIEDPRNIQVGEEVFAIGSPLGFTFSVTNGIVSAMFRDFKTMYNTLQTNTAINPGNSGGPLFNLQGHLVGINSFMVTPSPFEPVFTGLGFAVSPSQQLEFLVKASKTIPELRRYQWLHTLLLSLGNKKLDL